MSLTTMLTKKSPEYSRIVFSTVVWRLRNDVIYSLHLLKEKQHVLK